MGKYFDEHYVVLSYGDFVGMYKGRLPSGDAPIPAVALEQILSQPGGIDSLEIRNNGRFVIAQKAGDFQVYDNELKQVSKTTLKNAGDTVSKLRWLDSYYAWSDQGGMLRLYEFDGANQHDIMQVISGQAVTLAQDGAFIYGFNTNESKTVNLMRTRLQN